jgi:hypothetical protein
MLLGMAGDGETGGQVFYRYEDQNGRLHIVNSPAALSSADRAKAERIELSPPPAATAAGVAAAARGFDGASFALGFGAAAILGAVLFSFKGGSRMLAKVAALLALVCLVGGAYFGWLRRTTGQGNSMVASPNELVNDARRAVEAVSEKRRERDRILEEVEREAR